MAEFTQHYGLHQWKPEDNFLRSDFNQDFSRVDAALHGLEEEKADRQATQTALSTKLEAVFGTFKGSGGSLVRNLGFRPKAVFIACSHVAAGQAYVGIDGEANSYITITNTGFTVNINQYSTLNSSGTLHAYMAIR